MEYGFVDFLTLIGSLGLFLFGMKMMSEALQKAAGSKMRQILASMTSNRFKAVLTGITVTTAVQSSSATTVMIVSFVNAGLLSLIESIGVIMGANIGTTTTAWLIAILGFNVKISALSLPIIGLGFPFLFSRKSQRRFWAEFAIGFALVFMGLEYLKESVPDIQSHPEILEFLRHYTNLGLASTLLFVLIGSVLTVIIQSSSATLALTLVMCNNGWIPFDIAAAMVLGENIGTTITANIAAMVGNVSARRAARAHLIFNIFGVVWILALMPVFLNTIASSMSSWSMGSPYENVASIPVALALFHTSFNIANTLLLIGAARIIERAVTYMVPQKREEDDEFRLKYISFGLLTTPEMSILQAKREIQLFASRVARMVGFVREMLNSKDIAEVERLERKIVKYEQISDNIEVEIATYLTRILENSDVTGVSSRRIRSMYKIIDEIESIADCAHNIMRTVKRKRETKTRFTREQYKSLNQMFDKVNEAIEIMNSNIETGYRNIKLDKAIEVEKMINSFRNELKSEHLNAIEKKSYSYLTGIYYNDIYCECEKMADHMINVSESIWEILHPPIAR